MRKIVKEVDTYDGRVMKFGIEKTSDEILGFIESSQTGSSYMFSMDDLKDMGKFLSNAIEEDKKSRLNVGDVVDSHDMFDYGVIMDVDELAREYRIFTGFEVYHRSFDDTTKVQSKEKIDEWDKRLRSEGMTYSRGQKRIIPFFKPFSKVVVRNNNEWTANIFSHYMPENIEHPYKCIKGCYKYCLPATEKNIQLIGTHNTTVLEFWGGIKDEK